MPRHSGWVRTYDIHAGWTSWWPTCGRLRSVHLLSIHSLADVPEQGGYNLESITHSALAVTEIILGGAPGEMKSLVASEAAAETVWLVAKEQSKYWKSVSPKACEPQEGTFCLCFSSHPLTSVLDAASLAFSVPGIHISCSESHPSYFYDRNPQATSPILSLQ